MSYWPKRWKWETKEKLRKCKESNHRVVPSVWSVECTRIVLTFFKDSHWDKNEELTVPELQLRHWEIIFLKSECKCDRMLRNIATSSIFQYLSNESLHSNLPRVWWKSQFGGNESEKKFHVISLAYLIVLLLLFVSITSGNVDGRFFFWILEEKKSFLILHTWRTSAHYSNLFTLANVIGILVESHFFRFRFYPFYYFLRTLICTIIFLVFFVQVLQSETKSLPALYENFETSFRYSVWRLQCDSSLNFHE